jgi:hypothetical protein
MPFGSFRACARARVCVSVMCFFGASSTSRIIVRDPSGGARTVTGEQRGRVVWGQYARHWRLVCSRRDVGSPLVMVSPKQGAARRPGALAGRWLAGPAPRQARAAIPYFEPCGGASAVMTSIWQFP